MLRSAHGNHNGDFERETKPNYKDYWKNSFWAWLPAQRTFGGVTMGKAKASTIAIVYGKMYGISLPTVEKIENAAMMADIVTWVYIIAQNDAVKNQWRLLEIEAIIKEKYDTPGERRKRAYSL